MGSSFLRIGLGAALAILLATSNAPMTSASAAALRGADEFARHSSVTISHKGAAPAAAEPSSVRSHRNAVMRPKITPARGFGLARRQPSARSAIQHKPAGHAVDIRAERATTVRAALARAQVPNTCSGALQPDTVYPCTT